MRVLLATPAFAPEIGGAETWTRAVFAALVARGVEVSVVARAVAGGPNNYTVDGIDVRRVGGGRSSYLRAVAAAINDEAHDVVVAQYAGLPAALAAARRRRQPVVAIMHDVYGWAESRRIKGVLGGAARWVALERVPRLLRPDHVLTPSRATAARVAELLPGVPVTVVPAGADHLDRNHDRRPTPGSVAFVGRLVHQKGVVDLLHAVGRLRAGGRDVSAVIVGRGPERDRLHSLAATMPGAVTFREGLSDDELDDVLCSASALALPSTREGWGLAITEASARGTPYVAYDIPAVREQHELLAGGLLVAPGVDSLAAGLARILDDPASAEAAAAAAEVASTLTWKRSAPVVEAALEQLVQGRGRRRAR